MPNGRRRRSEYGAEIPAYSGLPRFPGQVGIGRRHPRQGMSGAAGTVYVSIEWAGGGRRCYVP